MIISKAKHYFQIEVIKRQKTPQLNSCADCQPIQMKSLLLSLLLVSTIAVAFGDTCKCFRTTRPTCTGIIFEGDGRCSSPPLTDCQQCRCDNFGLEDCEIIPSQVYRYNGTEDYCSLESVDEVQCPKGPPPTPPPLVPNNITFCCSFTGQGSMIDYGRCELPSWQSTVESGNPYVTLDRIFGSLVTDVVLDLSYNANAAILSWSYNSNYNFTYRLSPGLPELFSYYANPIQSGLQLGVVVPPTWTRQEVYNMRRTISTLQPGDPDFTILKDWPQASTVFEMLFRATVTSPAQRVATYSAATCITYEYTGPA